MTINPKVILLNLIVSVALYETIFKNLLITGLENNMFIFVFVGLISSLMIKEYRFGHYIKRVFYNSTIFSLLFVLIFVFDMSMADKEFHVNLDVFILLSIFIWLTHFFGSLAGIVPQGICERFRKKEKATL
ncbi:MAG: hypothetical protein WA063_01355 [Minisyncoccia bacterium]